ncbi:sensor histidine kinase [Labilithrix luteola]|uniref:Sensor histidine kinase n=1 Tax=Labilithrix luteola TaxID=1391654 RepID=A0A0K1PMU9_9BACT|nr:response regulator transcription factor [Labilithrix luteola]AKU94865.1 sensor histidine kinase [Labilithrix luteola]
MEQIETVEGPLVLLVEANARLGRELASALRAKGYRSILASTGRAAVAEAKTRNPDVVLLDLELSDVDGMSVLDEIRTWSRAPIIAISGRPGDADVVAALDLGADDCMTKPFGMNELLARLRRRLRGATHVMPARLETPFRTGALVVDLDMRRVAVDGNVVRLTPIEYKILATLVRRAGAVVTRQELLTEVWGPHCAGQGGYLRVYMVHLRKKVEPNPSEPRYIVTESRRGYRVATA